MVLVPAVAACGVTTIRSDAMVERHYLGYVKVVVPDSYSERQRVSATDVAAIGLRVENGLGVGYFRDRKVVTPLDCRFVVLVKTRQQLDETVRLISKADLRGDICASVFPGS